VGGRRRGGDRQAFAEADTIVSRDIIYPRCHPAPLETCGIIADFNPRPASSTSTTATRRRTPTAPCTRTSPGLAEHMIRISCKDIGGGFGNKVPGLPGLRVRDRRLDRRRRAGQVGRDRSENLMSTGFARDYIMHAEMCAKDGRSPACGST
jgi:carbon-monoxide dehydrogenase large subunit